jgi:hypothetical protein
MKDVTSHDLLANPFLRKTKGFQRNQEIIKTEKYSLAHFNANSEVRETGKNIRKNIRKYQDFEDSRIFEKLRYPFFVLKLDPKLDIRITKILVGLEEPSRTLKNLQEP